MSTPEVTAHHLLQKLLQDLQEPGFYWQVLALVVSLGAAWLLARFWRGKLLSVSQWKDFIEVLRDLVFPLTGAFLVLISRIVLEQTMHVHLLKVAVPLLLSLAVVRGVHHMLHQSFPHARWLGSIGTLFSVLVWGWLALYLSGASEEVIATLDMIGVQVGKQRVSLWMVLNGIVVVMLTLLASLWLASLVETKLMGARDVDSSLRIVLVRISKALFIIFSILISFSLVGINITALSVFTGALGVGLGLGLQKIASNYVAGFIILLDRSIRLGNLIQLDAQTSGMVTKITTRYTVLKNLGGVEFIVPNDALVVSIVQNHSYSDTRMRAATSISVSYSADLEQVVAILEEIARSQPRVLADPGPKASIVMFADSGINIELGFWVSDPDKGTGGLRSDINMEIWRRFRKEGIEIPFPQREVRILNPSPAMPSSISFVEN